MKEQIRQDANDALRYYGGLLDIREPLLLNLRGNQVMVQRIRLVYEGGDLVPADADVMSRAVNKARKIVPGVEVQVE